MLKELKRHMKVIKTCNLYLSMFTLGLSISLTGPCLLDLQHMVNTDTQHIATIYTARSTGDLLGAILGGILLDMVKYKQAVLMVCNFLVTVTMFGISRSRSVEVLMGFMAINGLSLGAIETGGNVICLQLWGKDSNPFFQGLHFTFGLGGLLSPLIAAPFLENFKDISITENSTYFDDLVLDSSGNFSSDINNITSTSLPRIAYPFCIIGSIALFVTILYLAVCIISPTEDAQVKDGTLDNSDKSCLFMFFFFILTFFTFFVVAGMGVGYAQTLTTYAVKGKLHVTTTTGSYMTSAFWAAFTVSRLASVFLAIKFSNLQLVIGDICIVTVAALILLFLMPNEWALWLASVIFGIGLASSFAALVGWVGTHINITNKISALFTVGCAAGDMVVPFTIAYFIDIIPDMFVYVIAAACVITTILVITLYFMFKTGKKCPKVDESHVIDQANKEVNKENGAISDSVLQLAK